MTINPYTSQTSKYNKDIGQKEGSLKFGRSADVVVLDCYSNSGNDCCGTANLYLN